MKNLIIVLIPARFGSTRFPGKALASINGKAMVSHVFDKARAEFDHVFVATDDQRIVDAVESHGGKAILTGLHHQSGTDRCAEAIQKTNLFPGPETIVINLQGDEPFIPSNLLKRLTEAFQEEEVEIATLMHPITDMQDVMNPNRVKVVFDKNNKALSFSRLSKPLSESRDQNSSSLGFQHIGIYAFRLSVLEEIVKLSPSPLEIKESLEQLRWLENGYSIHCIETDYGGFGIDTPEDLERATLLNLD